MDKNWLKNYDTGVPAHLQPYPESTLLDALSEAARQQPEHVILYFKGASLTCRQLERLSNAFAAAVQSLGIRKGDRVALMILVKIRSIADGGNGPPAPRLAILSSI